MSFAIVADRIRRDFDATPDLELTVAQGVRLWNLGVDDCRFVLDALVDAGFLCWTAKRTVVRSSETARGDAEHVSSHISVRPFRRSDISRSR
jgi:hypothetical protein